MGGKGSSHGSTSPRHNRKSGITNLTPSIFRSLLARIMNQTKLKFLYSTLNIRHKRISPRTKVENECCSTLFMHNSLAIINSENDRVDAAVYMSKVQVPMFHMIFVIYQLTYLDGLFDTSVKT